MARRTVALGVIAGVSMALAGCDEPLSNLAGPTPELRPAFSSIQEQIFEHSDSSGRPACVQCHNAGGQFFAGGLNLEHTEAYTNLVNVPSRDKPDETRVIPADPENSYLIHKLEGRSTIVGGRMPFNGPYLTSGQIDVIKHWIEQGAAND
jgi:hypothetical protein